MDYPISVPGIGLVGGRFVDENPVTGQVGSIISSAWANAVMDELLAILAHAGITPDEDTLDQVQQAIWKPASESFAGVAALATAAEGQAGVDAAKIITAAVLKAVLDARPVGVPAATFAEVDATTSDQGPVLLTDMAGELYTWQFSPYFNGYRSARCGLIYGGPWDDPDPWEALLTGGVWSVDDPRQARLIAKFREKGRTTPAVNWAKGVGLISDIGNGNWKAPDYQDVFLRMSGTDADTANARLAGAHQNDALQNIVGTLNASNIRNGVATGAFAANLAGAQAAGSISDSLSDTTGFSFDPSRVARTSVETRGSNTAVAPVILI
ncbi:hypothetical protein [Castellaniella sp. UC4442_H9]